MSVMTTNLYNVHNVGRVLMTSLNFSNIKGIIALILVGTFRLGVLYEGYYII